MSTANEQARTALQNSSFLGGLPAALLDQLAQRAHVKTYDKGETIYRRGETGDTMMVILTGRVKITNVTAEAREVILNFLGPGDVNGEIAVLDGGERTANAVALEETQALVLYRRDLLPVLTADPASMLEIITILCDKIRATSLIVEDNSLQMQGRTASGLLRLANQHGRKTAAGIRIELKLSQRDLGNYVGLSRENTSRQLKDLREAGLVIVDDQALIIPNLEALRDRAESGET
ncbi:MAG: Crp/Fnr family transcriptional regulator [Hyphomicrobiaceae bacterium]